MDVTFVPNDPEWEDRQRLNDLVKQHRIGMRVDGGLWYFDDLGWRAASQAEALALAEGYDRCTARRTTRIRRTISLLRP